MAKKEQTKGYLAETVANIYSYYKKHFIEGVDTIWKGVELLVDDKAVISGESYLSTVANAPSMLKILYKSGKCSQTTFKACKNVVKMTEYLRDSKLARVIIIRQDNLQLISRFTRTKEGNYTGQIHEQVPPSVYEVIGGYH